LLVFFILQFKSFSVGFILTLAREINGDFFIWGMTHNGKYKGRF
jgi:hypothetical protein